MTDSGDDFVKTLVANAPQTWSEVGARISLSEFPTALKELGRWSTAALSEELGDDWPTEFITKNKRPLVPTLLAPHLSVYIYKLAEVGLQLKLLRDVAGMSRLRADMIGPPSEDSWGHSLLVLSVAALEYRRSGDVAVEIPGSPGAWHPDLALTREQSPILVECFQMVVGQQAIEMIKSGRSDAPNLIDEWKRVGRPVSDKSSQASQHNGWLRCELNSGIFHNIDWYEHSLGVGSLEDRLGWLVFRLRESLQFWVSLEELSSQVLLCTMLCCRTAITWMMDAWRWPDICQEVAPE